MLFAFANLGMINVLSFKLEPFINILSPVFNPSCTIKNCPSLVGLEIIALLNTCFSGVTVHTKRLS